MNRRQALLDATARLMAAGVPDARLDAEWMLSHLLGVPRLSMLAFSADEVPPDTLSRFLALIARREAGEPLQYAIGEASFMGRALRVDARALIPRGDTETLCEALIARLSPGMRLLDIGTGSGALAIAAAFACPGADVTGADISADALSVARANGERLGARVRWVQSDLFEGLLGESFDIIVSNPPYIPTGDIASLQREVLWEPKIALDGGPDGLAFYRRIIAALPGRLAPGGSLLFEAGDGQAADVAAMMRPVFSKIEIIPDMNGLERAIAGDGYAG